VYEKRYWSELYTKIKHACIFTLGTKHLDLEVKLRKTSAHNACCEAKERVLKWTTTE